MATYIYKPLRRLISVTTAAGITKVLEIGYFNASGKLTTVAVAKVALLDKAQGVTKKGAVADGP